MQRAQVKSVPQGQAYPDKLFYKIGEISRIVDVEPYVLRYWESEFSFLKPRKSRSGQRVYIKKDLELVQQIKRLLYEERYTIEGVRKRLGEPSPKMPVEDAPQAPPPDKAVAYIKQRLRDILNRFS